MASETQDGELFFEDVPAELCCSICCGVLRDPRDTPCGCTFCQGCIMTWLTKSSTCPTDRQPLRPNLLKPTHRIVSSLLGRMRLRCPHHHKGCTVVLTVETVEQHEAICIFRGGVFRPWPKPAAKSGPAVSSTPTAQAGAMPPATIPRRRPRAPPAPSSLTQPPATAVNAPAPSWGNRVPAGSTTTSPLAPRATTTTTTTSNNSSSTTAAPSTPLLSVPRNIGNSPLFDSTLRSPLLGHASSAAATNNNNITPTPTTNSTASATTPSAPRLQQQVFGSGVAGTSGLTAWGASPVASSPSVLPPPPPSPGSEPLFTFGSTATTSSTSTTTTSSRRHGHRQHATPPLNNRAGQGAQRVVTFGAATPPFSSTPFSLFSNSPGMPSWGSLPDPVPGNVGEFGLANNPQSATTQAPASSPSFAASNNAPSSSTAPAAPVFVFGRANCAPPQATPNMAQQQPQQPQTQQQPMQVAASSS